MTKKNNFYLPILNELKTSTNISKITKKLNISRQDFNYYIQILKKNGYVIQKGKGWYEINNSKKLTNHDNFLSKDSIRGHAYVWKIKLPQEIKDWDKRIEVLKKNNINFNLIGAKNNTPRIKVLGRKVWLCNDNIRIFDKKGNSYYGETAKESKYTSLNEFYLIVVALEKKLNITFKPLEFDWKKEHYSLIKNDLAIEHNRKGEILRIKDGKEEWLIIDDSLEQGGELETIGKDSYKINIPMQKWWNDNKKHNFQVTPSFLLESMNHITNNQLMFNQNFESHIKAIKQLGNSTEANSKTIELLADVVKDLVEEVRLLRR